MSSPSITSITPSTGDVASVVYITDLAGEGFDTVAFVRLKYPPWEDEWIEATDIVTVSDASVTCTFDVSGYPAGVYDVYLENGDGGNTTYPGLFEIVQLPPTVTGADPASAVSGTLWSGNIEGTYLLWANNWCLKKSGKSDISGGELIKGDETYFMSQIGLDGADYGLWDIYVELDDAQNFTLSKGFEVEPLVGGSSTGDWNTTTKTLTLQTGQIGQSSSIYKSASGNVIKGIMTVTANDLTDALLYLSADGGTHWEAVTSGVELTFVNAGSDLRWKILNNGGGGGETGDLFPLDFSTGGVNFDEVVGGGPIIISKVLVSYSF